MLRKLTQKMRYDTFSGVVILIYMSLLWQISPSYNTDDKTQNMHDMRKVLRLSEKASQYEQRVIDILTWVTEEKRAKILVDMRNRLFDALSSSIPDSGHYAGIGFLDGLNQGHQKEYHFYNFLATNPALRQHFLIHLDQAIGALLKKDWWGINNINIAWKMQLLTGDSFDSTLGEIQQGSWQVWLVYFLEECIRTGKCLEQVWAYLANNYKKINFYHEISRCSISRISAHNWHSRSSWILKIKAWHHENHSLSVDESRMHWRKSDIYESSIGMEESYGAWQEAVWVRSSLSWFPRSSES